MVWSIRVNVVLYYGVAALLWAAPAALAEQEMPGVSFITGFVNPEDLLDVVGTPYLIVSEFGGSPTEARDDTGILSVYDTVDQQKIDLELLVTNDETAAASSSSLADPTCQNLPLDQLNPHGISGYARANDGIWELAVINHFRYESVEFYAFDPSQPSRLTALGCVVLLDGDFHNSVGYSPDATQIAVTVFMQRSFGVVGLLSFVTAFFGNAAGGAVKIIGTGGVETMINAEITTANGVFWGGVNGTTVYVAETVDNQIIALDTANGLAEISDVVIPALVSPDNLRPDTPTSFVFTTATASINPYAAIAACATLGFFCNSVGFDVMRYDWVANTTTTIYSMGPSDLYVASVALVKDNVLYAGGFETEVIIRAEL